MYNSLSRRLAYIFFYCKSLPVYQIYATYEAAVAALEVEVDRAMARLGGGGGGGGGPVFVRIRITVRGP